MLTPTSWRIIRVAALTDNHVNRIGYKATDCMEAFLKLDLVNVIFSSFSDDTLKVSDAERGDPNREVGQHGDESDPKASL